MSSNQAMEFAIENMKLNNNPGTGQQPMYRPIKKKLPRTYINILHDPRVVRGNTYAAFVIPSSLQKEFMYLKEQEERRKKLMNFPKKLPRVAYLSKKTKEDRSENKEQQEERPETPKLQELEDPEYIEDYPYFYIDKPPTPEHIDPPKGREIHSQVEDGELFDFELEVKPILEVLVGKSLIHARMELIEQHERNEYLKHKKQYEQLREFELVNLQRQEAARIRREEEKKRRENQKEERRKNNIITQKKLIAKQFAKRMVFPLKSQCFNHLLDAGVLKPEKEFNIVKMIDRSLINISEEIEEKNKAIENVLKQQLMENVRKGISEKHKTVVSLHNRTVENARIEKENKQKMEEEAEKKRKEDKDHERETRRFNRIKTKIEESNIAFKAFKQDLLNINLADIDEFSMKTEHVHTLGGYFGEVLLIFSEMWEKHIINMSEDEQNKTIYAMIARLLQSLDKRTLEIKYFETVKLDMTIPIDKADPANIDAYKAIYFDIKRIASKSIKYMLESGAIKERFYSMFMDNVLSLLLTKPVDPETVEKDRDPNNTDPDYLDKLNKEKEIIKQNNEFMAKLKEKVRFTYVKVEDFKKKRNKMAAVVTVSPSDQTDLFKEEEHDHIVLRTDNSGHGGDNKDSSAANNNVVVQQNVYENEMRYVNTVQVFQNTILPYDFYIFHEGATDFLRLKILNEFKNFFGKENFNLFENYQNFTKKAKMIKENLLNNIQQNEKFFEKEIKGYKPIFDFNVSSIENKPDQAN